MKALKTFLLVGAATLAVGCDSSKEDMSSGDTSTSTSTSGVAPGSSSGDMTGVESSSTTDIIDTTSGEPQTTGGTSSSTGGFDDSSSTGGSTTADGGQEGDVFVEVAYEGALEGSLTVAIFAACPPAGPPGAFAQEAEPVFPQTVEITGTTFAAGDMPCVIAYLDTGAPSPTSPGEEDPSGEVTFEVAAGEATTVELLLEDPA